MFSCTKFRQILTTSCSCAQSLTKNGIKHSAARDTPPIYVDHVSIDTLEKLISPTEAGSVLPDILRLHIGFSFLAGGESVEFYGALFDACIVLEEMTNAN